MERVKIYTKDTIFQRSTGYVQDITITHDISFENIDL